MQKPDEIMKSIKQWTLEHNQLFKVSRTYVFGSLIYKNGLQYSEFSDIDLVTFIPSSLEKPVERQRWLFELSNAKIQLEHQLLQLLEVAQLDEPIVSIIPVTEIECRNDIHKSNIPEFFSKNNFISIEDESSSLGIPSIEKSSADRLFVGCLSVVQNYRHAFCHVLTNGRRNKLLEYDDSDPIPKSLMRAAAMARCCHLQNHQSGEEYDLQEGLDYFYRNLDILRDTDDSYGDLYTIISERRGSRGKGGALSAEQQLLIAEIIYESCISKVSPATDHDIKAKTLKRGKERSVGTIPDDAIKELTFVPQSDDQPVTASDKSVKKETTEFDFADLQDATEESQESPKFGNESSLAFFEDRFKIAFPGIRSLEFYYGQDASDRLLRLLAKPIRFSDKTPIWWWRGGNFNIERFEQIEGQNFLMNHDELKIRHVAALHSDSYKRLFVYVRCDPMKPTGLHPVDKEGSSFLENHGYDYEEYGLFDKSIKINRAEYDDGGTYLEGKYVPTSGNTELRIRYITPYNFVISAVDSPINNIHFDSKLTKFLNLALTEKENEEEILLELKKEVVRLPLRESEYT
ncbi:MAG: hypothetical protein ABJN65_08065 [Parasphingorhabdus sp.]